MTKQLNICPFPFEEVEINPFGEVYTCCPSWNNYYSIGNIYKDSLENIWNSPKAVELREKILNNDYSFCNEDHCFVCKSKNFTTKFETEYKTVMSEYPKSIKYCYDYECNAACIMCRDKIHRLTKEEEDNLNKKIDTLFIPLLQDAKILTINTAGDPFGSRHSREVIKQAVKKYPKLKFDFTTNGLLLTKNMLENLNVNPKQIDTVRISIHAATKETYGKIVQNGKSLFDNLLSNLHYIADLKKQYNFTLLFNFVVMSVNYKEMPMFIEFAKKYNAYPIFWEYKKDSCAYVEYDPNLDVVNKSHKCHKDLIKVLHKKEMYGFEGCLYPSLLELQNSEL